MIAGRPVTRRASLSAASIASDPELRKKTVSIGGGRVATSFRARIFDRLAVAHRPGRADEPVDLGVDRRGDGRVMVPEGRDRDPVGEVEVGACRPCRTGGGPRRGSSSARSSARGPGTGAATRATGQRRPGSRLLPWRVLGGSTERGERIARRYGAARGPSIGGPSGPGLVPVGRPPGGHSGGVRRVARAGPPRVGAGSAALEWADRPPIATHRHEGPPSVIDFTLTDENRLVQQSARAFAEAEILPHIRDWDERGEVHREVFARMGELGFLGAPIPEAYGGAGMDYISFAHPVRGARAGRHRLPRRPERPRRAELADPAPVGDRGAAPALPRAPGAGREAGHVRADRARRGHRRRQPPDDRPPGRRPVPAQRPEDLDQPGRPGRPLPRLRDRRPGEEAPRRHRVHRRARHSAA